MDASEVYPDVLGDAVSHSSQRLTQLGSLVTAAATMEVRRRAQVAALKAARSEQELKVLREQERVARQAARAGWAPAHDSRWLAQADLLQVAGVWGAAAAYADADAAAGSAMRRCEERLRVLHPYAMARYDRLRSEGAGVVEAMRQAVPMFGRVPHARPGDPAAERRVLEAPARLDSVDGIAANQNGIDVRVASAHVHRDRTPAQLAAESFPCTAADAVTAAAKSRMQAGQSSTRTVAAAHPIRNPGRSL
jgi:hypothetical protein